MQWTMFGYEDDTPEMTRHRLRQGNLMGPAGFLGLEDNEAMKFVQEGLRRSSTGNNVLKLDAGNVGTSQGLISESCIRAMYQYYRGVMDIRVAGAAA
jgi:anthranilate 1,2-dioxygenase large subunit